MAFDVLAELDAHAGERFTPEEAYAWCKAYTKDRASNFYYAFTILPAEKRNAIYAAYAFSGYVDDIADELTDRSRQEHEIALARERLETCYAGDAPGAAVHRPRRRRRPLRDAAGALRGAGERGGDGLHHQPLRDVARPAPVLLPRGLDGGAHLRLHLRGQAPPALGGVRHQHGHRPPDREHHAGREGGRGTGGASTSPRTSWARTTSRPTTSSRASATSASAR